MPNMRFNPPPTWPAPPSNWSPPPGWEPDPSWGPAPAGWSLWVPEERSSWLRRHKVLAGVGGGVAGMVALLIIIGAAGTSASGPATTPVAAQAAAETTDPTEPSYAVPSGQNLELSVRTTSQHCFGSAGCNVQYEVEVGIVGGVTFDPSITYDVTIQTLGSDDGPRIDTFTITGDRYESIDGSVSTASAGTELTAVITDVEAE